MVADLAVVGAGPAGMAAALAAAERGARVVLVDSWPQLGGQYFRQPLVCPRPLGRPEPSPDGGYAPALPPAADGVAVGPHLPGRSQALMGHPHIELLLGHAVWSVARQGAGFLLHLHPEDEPASGVAPAGEAWAVHARALVLATGATELVLPFPGWDLPGVTTAGAAQALLKSQQVTVGRKVVVAGTGPLLWPVAGALARAGAQVLMAEAAPPREALRLAPALLRHPRKLAEAAGYAGTMLRHRARAWSGQAVVRCEGHDRAERVVLARLGPDWRPLPGTETSVDVDALCVSHGFVPRLELAVQLGALTEGGSAHPAMVVTHGQTMSTSVPGLFVAGELAGVAGAEVAELEGQTAGHAAASYLGLPDPRPGRDRQRLGRRLANRRAFASALERSFGLGPGWISWLDDSTVFCRCEQVSWGQVRAAVQGGASSVRQVRSLTRCGMGYCQGRTCGPPLQLVVAALSGRPLGEVGNLHKRPVAVPVTLAQLSRAGTGAAPADLPAEGHPARPLSAPGLS